MLRRWIGRAALTAALALGGWAGTARADDSDEAAPPPEPGRHWTVLGWWHNHRPLCCWASHNGFSCTSLHAECTFIFGSCRAFYSEPCLKGPPPSPLPPGAEQPPGAGTASCGCQDR
jgi:hypothetical protein